MKNTSCENWTLKSSEQRKWTSRYRQSNYKAYHCAVHGAVVIENFLPQYDGRRNNEENRQKEETGEDFLAKKTEFWHATHLIYEQYMIDLSRCVMKYFWRRSFHGERSIANMILFRKAISLGLNDQYNTLSTFDKNTKTTTQACKYFSLWGYNLVWQVAITANLFEQQNIWKVKLIVAQSINRWIEYLTLQSKIFVPDPESLKNIVTVKRD